MFEVVEGHYIALLGCSRRPTGDTPTDVLLSLALEEAPAVTENERGRPTVYHLWRTDYSHYVEMSANLASELKWKSMEVFISLRPTYRQGETGPWTDVARLMVSSPGRPYMFKPSVVTRWRGLGGDRSGWSGDPALFDVQMPPLPWTGSYPVILLFQRQYGEKGSVLVLGRCTKPEFAIQVQDNRGDASSRHTPLQFLPSRIHTLGPHYAVMRQYDPSGQRPDVRSFVEFDHSCEHDHVDFGRIPEYPKWTESAVKTDYHSVQFRRSPSDPTGTMLEVRVLTVDMGAILVGLIMLLELANV